MDRLNRSGTKHWRLMVRTRCQMANVKINRLASSGMERPVRNVHF